MNIVDINNSVKATINLAVVASTIMPVVFKGEYGLEDQTKDFCEINVSDNGTVLPSFSHLRIGIISFNIYQKRGRGKHRALVEALRLLALFPVNTVVGGLTITSKGQVADALSINSTWDLYPCTINYETMEL